MINHANANILLVGSPWPWSPHHLEDHGVPGQRQGQVENRFDQLGAQWRIPDFQRKNAGETWGNGMVFSIKECQMPGAGASLANVHAELSYFESESIILIIVMIIIISSIMIIIYIYIIIVVINMYIYIQK